MSMYRCVHCVEQWWLSSLWCAGNVSVPLLVILTVPWSLAFYVSFHVHVYTTYLVSTCDAGTYWAQFAGEGE